MRDVRPRRRQAGYIKAGPIGIGNCKYRTRENEVVIHSDETILRFGGSLSDEDKAWLAEACRCATVHGQLP